MQLEMRGIAVLVVAAMLAVVGIVRADGVLLALAGAGLALLGGVCLLGRHNLRRLQLECDHFAAVAAGDRVRSRLRIRNPRRFLDALRVEAWVSGPGGMEFSSEGAAWIPAGAEVEIEAASQAERRGVCAVMPFALKSDFPWGWIRFERGGELVRSVRVVPQALWAKEMAWPGRGDPGWHDWARYAARGGAEWRGLRAYHAGDRVRDVAWAASARSTLRGGGLLVRETEPPANEAREITLIFHSAGQGRDLIRPGRFEHALALFYGETLRWAGRGVRVVWRADFEQWVPRLIQDRTAARRAGLILAAAQREPGTELHELAARLAECPGLVRIFSDMPGKLWASHVPATLRAGVVDVREYERRPGR